MVDKRFEPHGVTVLALLAESHASIHSYPERGAMFVDVFTGGESADVAVAGGDIAATGPTRHRQTPRRGGRTHE